VSKGWNEQLVIRVKRREKTIIDIVPFDSCYVIVMIWCWCIHTFTRTFIKKSLTEESQPKWKSNHKEHKSLYESCVYVYMHSFIHPGLVFSRKERNNIRIDCWLGSCDPRPSHEIQQCRSEITFQNYSAGFFVFVSLKRRSLGDDYSGKTQYGIAPIVTCPFTFSFLSFMSFTNGLLPSLTII